MPKTLWSWGYNDYGQLGLGDEDISRSSPVQIGSVTDWNSVDSGYYYVSAIKTDGSLWSWGRGDDGQLGHGAETPRSSPEQVGSLTDCSFITCGE